MAQKNSFWTKNFTLLFFSNAFLFMVYNMQVPVLPLYGEKIGLDAGQIGIFVGMIMFTGLIVRLFAGHLAQIFSKRKLLLLGIMLYLAATFGYPLLTSFSLLVLLRALNGIGKTAWLQLILQLWRLMSCP